MKQTYDKMERCFRAGYAEWAELAGDPDWRVRYAAAVAAGRRREPEALDVLAGLLEREDSRPLYTQPETRYIGTAGDSSLAEQVKPFGVVFPEEPDEATKEAWKCRGRIKQAALFALYEIGAATDALVGRLHRYVNDPGEDAGVKSAALRALGKVGNAETIALCRQASHHFDSCVRLEAAKSLEVLTRD